MPNLITEEFKSIKGYEGIYEVSNLGNAISLERVVTRKNGVITKTKMKSLTLSPNRGYLTVCLSKNGATKKMRAHRAVAETFIPNPENKPSVNHIDGDKTNNEVSNLEWVTQTENMQHAIKMGLHEPFRNRARGERCGSSKLTEKDIRYIRKNSIKNGGKKNNGEMARELGVFKSTVKDVVNKKSWGHVK